ncbi:hypothetical protein GIB67_028012 [Kingdonia uniflora]|uniref:Uncharacterized protein n=1 Tax=Kingdonia uniflora TaxID=39325 RepID=A0A7J7L795_9MAGN|nr:hypothetical protein GIB67_028012 [Kingdonia uniflora]
MEGNVWFRRNVRGLTTSQRNIHELYEERRHNLCVFSYSELQNATNDLSRLLKTGEGGFGSVYEGLIKPHDGNGDRIVVPVKKLDDSELQNFRSRRDAIEEAQDLKKMKPDTLAGKLQTFELEMKMENPKKNKNVAFKSSSYSSSSKGTIEADNSSDSDNDDGPDMDSQIASISHQLKNLAKQRQFKKQRQSVNHKSQTHDQHKANNRQTNLDTNLSLIECYKCHKLGHYAHSSPNKKSGTNHKVMNISVTWDDSDDENNNNESHPQVVDNGNYCAYPTILNCDNDNYDIFKLENFVENQSDQEQN